MGPARMFPGPRCGSIDGPDTYRLYRVSKTPPFRPLFPVSGSASACYVTSLRVTAECFARLSHRLGVCLSVCPSVCHNRDLDLYQNGAS